MESWAERCSYIQALISVVSVNIFTITLANSLLDLAIRRDVKIVQKYLVVGHTQMEVDSMHATIERKLVGDIIVPHDYVVVMESARLKPSPYIVKEVSHDEVLKLDGSYLSSIRPGKKAGDPTVYDLRALEFKSTGAINYKLDFSENSRWEQLPQRINCPKSHFHGFVILSKDSQSKKGSTMTFRP